MGTRSRIGVFHGDNVKSVYCHWDGYLDHNGRILLNHYDSAKANQLVALGDLSVLHANIGEKHDFNEQYKDGCTFYGRDRGETGVSARYFKDFEHYEKNHQYEEYEYILRQVDGKAVWFVCYNDAGFIKLESALKVTA